MESEDDQFQDFPFDMTDFVTVDEVGDECEEEEKGTETPCETEAETTPVPETSPQVIHRVQYWKTFK